MQINKKPSGIQVNEMQINFSLSLSTNEIKETIKNYKNFYKNKKDSKGNKVKIKVLY